MYGKVLIVRVQSEWKSPLSKHLSQTEKDQIAATLNVENGDLLLVTAGTNSLSSILNNVYHFKHLTTKLAQLWGN